MSETQKQSILEKLEEDLAIANTKEFENTKTWKLIENIYFAKFNKLITPQVAEAKVQGFAGKILGKTTNSKQYAELTRQIQEEVVLKHIRHSLTDKSTKEFASEKYQPLTEQTVESLRVSLDFPGVILIGKEIDTVSDKKVKAGIENLQELLSELRPVEINSLLSGVNRIYLTKNNGSDETGQLIFLQILNKKGGKQWQTIPPDSGKYAKSVLRCLREAKARREKTYQETKKNNPGQDKRFKVWGGIAKEALETVEDFEENHRDSIEPKEVLSVENSGSTVDNSVSRDVAEILPFVEIHGDDPEVTPEFLAAHGVLPEFELDLQITDRKIYSSQCFKYRQDYLAAVLFVEDQGKLIARTYYRSRSGGVVWRYEPFQSDNRIGKGYGHKNSVVAPGEMQGFLNEVIGQGLLELDQEVAEKVFKGTAKHKVYDGHDDDLDDGRYTYFAEQGVSAQPIKFLGKFEPDPGDWQFTPEDIEFDNAAQAQRPDYENIIGNWKATYTDPLYGQEVSVEVDLIASKDKKFNYMFCWDAERDRAWIGMIEPADSEVTSTGLRKQWVDAGLLTTPPVDYRQHDEWHLGVEVDPANVYVDMFPNLVSKISEVARYLSFKKSSKNS